MQKKQNHIIPLLFHCAVGLYPDAAGASNMRIGKRLGVVLEMHGICHRSFLGHSELIKENGRTISGDRVGLKMSFL